jgi:hypothetical protein
MKVGNHLCVREFVLVLPLLSSAKNFLLILVRMKQGCTAFHPIMLLPSSLLKDFSSPSAAITSFSVTTATDG